MVGINLNIKNKNGIIKLSQSFLSDGNKIVPINKSNVIE